MLSRERMRLQPSCDVHLLLNVSCRRKSMSVAVQAVMSSVDQAGEKQALLGRLVIHLSV